MLDRRTGMPMDRYANSPTPCHKCEKVPLELRLIGAPQKELRAAAVELTSENRRAWRFYRECRAVNQFPDDPLTRWYAAGLRDMEDKIAREPIERLTLGLSRLADVLEKGRR